MDKKSTFGLKLHQLKELLSIAVDEANFLDEISDSETVAEMLQNQFVTSVSRNSSLLDSLLVIIGKMGYGMDSFSGKSLSDLLLNSETDISLLKAIKIYSKKLSLTLDSGDEHTVAVTIYHAAIASAIVYHGRNVSSSSYATLEDSFAVFTEKDWLTPGLKTLFSRARDVCRQKQQKK